jgi:hypothetical protein
LGFARSRRGFHTAPERLAAWWSVAENLAERMPVALAAAARYDDDWDDQ